MASVTDLIAEIQDASRLLKRRSAPDLATGLMNSIATKIGTVPSWDTKTASRMADAIDEAKLSDEMKAVLHDACDKRLAACIDASANTVSRPASGAPTRDQTMRHIANYFTASDYAVFDDPAASQDQRNAKATARLERLCVRRASETGMIKWLVSFLLDCEFRHTRSWSSYWAIYNRVLAVKGLLHGLPQYNGPVVDKFPELPRDLPSSVFEAAYDSTDPPIMRHVPMLEEISRHVPLRKTSHLLATEPNPMTQSGRTPDGQLTLLTQALQAVGRASQHRHHGDIDMEYFGKYAEHNRSWSGPSWSGQPWSSYGAGWHDGQESVDERRHAALEWKPQHKRARTQLSIEDAPPTAEVDGQPATDEVDSQRPAEDKVNPWAGDKPAGEKRPTSKDIEDAAYQALLARHQPGPLKRPAAAAALKKPAAASTTCDDGRVRDIKYPKIKFNDDDAQRTRNCYGSLHYCRAKTIIRRSHPHMTAEDKRATLSDIHIRAMQVWDKHMK